MPQPHLCVHPVLLSLLELYRSRRTAVPQYWAPLEDCRIPGALQERLPFMCPMDYVLGAQLRTAPNDAWPTHARPRTPVCSLLSSATFIRLTTTELHCRFFPQHTTYHMYVAHASFML